MPFLHLFGLGLFTSCTDEFGKTISAKAVILLQMKNTNSVRKQRYVQRVSVHPKGCLGTGV